MIPDSPPSPSSQAEDAALERLLGLLKSDIPLQRLVAVKHITQECQSLGLNATVQHIIPALHSTTGDSEAVIRQALAEEIGKLVSLFVPEKSTSSSSSSSPSTPKTVERLVGDSTQPGYKALVEHLIPLLGIMIVDVATEVQHIAGASLIEAAQVLNDDDLHEHILNMVLCLAHDDNDEHRVVAVPLMNGLAPIVGPHICKLFIAQEVVALSQDPSFRVRKTTAQNFSNVCLTVGTEVVEQRLLPAFSQLCKDSIWSVRKGCVESLVKVSQSISLPVRQEVLVPVFKDLSRDVSRWVRNGAYEAFGPFIATLNSDTVTTDFLKLYTSIPEMNTSNADSEIMFNCAYNFAAVVLTVGAPRWPELRQSYKLLAKDNKFKVRRTLAYSIHEIAKIVGTSITETDLVPVFDVFLKDIDQVRTGIYKHLSSFLAVLGSSQREAYLDTLKEMHQTPDTVWRYRRMLAQQTDLLAELYSPRTTADVIVPLSLSLCRDRMFDVRLAAIHAIGALLIRLKRDHMDAEVESLIREALGFASDSQFHMRQLYVRLCATFVQQLPPEQFVQHFLSPVLALASDPVSNVRLAVARFVYKVNFSERGAWCRLRQLDQVKVTESVLKRDVNLDVAFFVMTPDEFEVALVSRRRDDMRRKAEANDAEMRELLESESESESGSESEASSRHSQSEHDIHNNNNNNNNNSNNNQQQHPSSPPSANPKSLACDPTSPPPSTPITQSNSVHPPTPFGSPKRTSRTLVDTDIDMEADQVTSPLSLTPPSRPSHSQTQEEQEEEEEEATSTEAEQDDQEEEEEEEEISEEKDASSGDTTASESDDVCMSEAMAGRVCQDDSTPRARESPDNETEVAKDDG